MIYLSHLLNMGAEIGVFGGWRERMPFWVFHPDQTNGNLLCHPKSYFSFLSYLPRYFRQELERLDEGLRKEDMAVHVRRDHVFEDSYRELHRKSPEEMKNRL